MNVILPRVRGLALVAAALLGWAGAAPAQTATAGQVVVLVTGPPELTDGVLTASLEAFAAGEGLGLKRAFRKDGGFDLILVSPDNPAGGVTLKVLTRSSTQARAAVGSGQAAFALARGPIAEGPGVVVAEDAMVAAVARDNSLKAITPAQLAGVLKGEITSWAALGGEDRPIRVYLMAPGTDQARLTDYYFLHGAAPAAGAQVVATEQELTGKIALDPDGIGVTGFSELGNTRALSLAGNCDISIAPDRDAIRNQDYPLSFAVALVAGKAPVPKTVADYLTFLVSPKAQPAIEQTGLVGIAPEREPLEAQGRRLLNAILLSGTEVPAAELRRLAATLDGQDRLSITFRFEPGATTLDAGSKEWIGRLAQQLKAGDYDGRKITFVGFSDGVGAADQNVKIGMARARAVEAAVTATGVDLAAHGITLGTESFGEALPIACDDREWGRQVNRRVEVWIR